MKDNLPRMVSSSRELMALRDEFMDFFDEIGPEAAGKFFDLPEATRDLESYLGKMEDYSRGVGLPDGFVPSTRYWYFSPGNRLIASASFRHRLTPKLEDFGGHIGYIVRPSFRGMGHATRLLSLVIEEARKTGLTRVLLTTDPENLASRKVIERNGGWLASESLSPITHSVKVRYWIDLLSD